MCSDKSDCVCPKKSRVIVREFVADYFYALTSRMDMPLHEAMLDSWSSVMCSVEMCGIARRVILLDVKSLCIILEKLWVLEDSSHLGCHSVSHSK
jgi:hypothetical protein